VLKEGDTVEAVVLAISPAERRISLGLKQALGDPWLEVPKKFPVGSAIEGPVTRLTKFGAFVELAEGVEGLVHISEIVADRRLNHPSEVLHTGEIVKAQVLAIDPEKRQIKLSIKQLIPTGLVEYIAEHKLGDLVSGRIVEASAESALVELGEGIRVLCRTKTTAPVAAKSETAGLDLSSLTSMLNARWKTGSSPAGSKPEPLAEGQIRSFKLTKIDHDEQQVEIELA